MTYLLDTDTCVYWLRGNAFVRDHLAAAGPDDFAISVVTLAELRYGASYSTQPEDNQRAIDDFVSGIAVVGLTTDAARTFGDVKASLRRQGLLIEDFDILIGATARAYGLTLVTSNASHFGSIHDLSHESWTSA